MATARETLRTLEEKIKIPPSRPGDVRALTAILSDASATVQSDYRSWLRQWVVKQGIPEASAKTSADASLIQAYCIPNYLRNWRNRVNPNFALLGGDEDDEIASVLSEPITKVPPPAEQAVNSGLSAEQSEKWLKSLWAQIDKSVNDLVSARLEKTTLKLDEGAKQQIRDLAKGSAKETIEQLMPPRQIEIINRSAGTAINIGLQHECFPKLLRAAQARNHQGYHLNIWLTGQPGSGKTHAAQSLAKALGYGFEAESGLDADFKVMGYRGPDGTYHETAFFRAFTRGGLMLMDEIDNFAPSALLALNSGTANDFVQFPHGMFKRHKDFILIACANTWGLGATNAFVGRTKLDAASLDRFQPKINWTTDEKLEGAIALGQAGEVGAAWHNIVLVARRAASRQGLQVIISPRATFSGISLLQAGFAAKEVIEMTLVAGLSAEQAKALGLSGLDTSVLDRLASPRAEAIASFQTSPGNHPRHGEIENYLAQDKLIDAIKTYRSLYDVGLLEAKNAVEAMRDSMMEIRA